MYTIGDVVTHVVTNRDMTVDEILGDALRCLWFDEGVLYSGYFPFGEVISW
jgi:hypothetical protein